MYGAEHNSGAPGLSAPAVRTECLLFSPQMSSLATPRHLLLPAGWGRTGQGWEESEGLVITVLSEVWLVWAGFEERVGVLTIYGILPAAVGTIIYWQALGETLVNTAQRQEISCVWVQQQNHLLCL